jgi:Phophatidylserine decarboxylase
MITPAGLAALLSPKLNRVLKMVLVSWAQFLDSPPSLPGNLLQLLTPGLHFTYSFKEARSTWDRVMARRSAALRASRVK